MIQLLIDLLAGKVVCRLVFAV